MKRLLGFMVAILLSGSAYAGDPWDAKDKWLAAAAYTTLAVDWGQTRYIAKHPERFNETNRILGEHPSVGRVDAYFAGVAIGTYLIADYLSTENRKLFLGILTVIEIGVTAHNRHIGMRMEF